MPKYDLDEVMPSAREPQPARGSDLAHGQSHRYPGTTCLRPTAQLMSPLIAVGSMG